MFNVICPGICQLIKCNNGPNVCDQRKERSAILTWIEFHSSLSNWMAEQGLGERTKRQQLLRAKKERNLWRAKSPTIWGKQNSEVAPVFCFYSCHLIVSHSYYSVQEVRNHRKVHLSKQLFGGLYQFVLLAMYKEFSRLCDQYTNSAEQERSSRHYRRLQ